MCKELTIICALLLFFSCTREESKQGAINQSLSVQSIGLESDTPVPNSEELKEGSVVAVACHEIGNNNSQTWQWVNFKKIGNQWLPMDGKQLSWPNGAERAVIAAYYPAEHSNPIDGSNESAWETFNLPCDQSGTNQDNLIDWADRMSNNIVIDRPSDNTISLKLNRRTSKVSINISSLDSQWDPAEAWISIDYVKPTHRKKPVVWEDNLKLFPANGKKLKLNNGQASMLLFPITINPANTNEFCTISVYESNEATSNKTTLKVIGYPNLSEGKSYRINIKVGKQKAFVEQYSIEPWGGKESITDVVGEFLPVMVVSDGIAHIYLDRAKASDPQQQIRDSIQSAEGQLHQVHKLVFYGKASGKLTLDAANNMIKNTNVQLLDISHVSDITEISESAFKKRNEYEFAKLEEIILSPDTKIIRKSAFEGSQIKKIITPGVETIEESAFKDCRALESANFPNLTGNLPSYSFENCIYMASCYMPKIEEIKTHAFKNSGLSKGDVGEVDFSSVTRIHSYAFEDSRLTGGRYIVGEIKNGLYVRDEFIFPNLIQVDDRAFRNCKQLSAISFPNAIRLGDYIFSGCNKLATVMITTKSPISYIGTNQKPFGHDMLLYSSELELLTLDYNSLVLNHYTTGIGTLIVHENKAYSETSHMEPRVTAITQYNGYQDIRGRVAFGLVSGGYNVTRWQEVIYEDDNGNRRIAH